MKTWIAAVHINEIPEMGSRVLHYKEEEIALFKTRDDKIFAVKNLCPHKQGKLAEGLVHDDQVTCPLHNWVIDLDSGEAQGSDCGCTTTYETKVEHDLVYIELD